jgi:DNA modification methylase
MCKEPTAFSPVLAKCIYDNLLPEEGGIVLDPFSGWGDRAIGALGSSKVVKYHGVDCNTDLTEGYSKIKEDLDSDDKLNFACMPFEDFVSDIKYDLIFTSPPYFDFETYSDEPTQSINSHKNYKQWFNNWFKIVLRKMVKMLSRKGIIALHIGTTYRTPSLPEDTRKFLTNECRMRYVQQIGCSVKDKRKIPIWIYENA